MKRAWMVIAAVVGLAGSAVRAGTAVAQDDDGCPLPSFGPGAQYHPRLEGDDFTATIDNPWMPLRPGWTFLYHGVKDGQPAVDVVRPTYRTTVIDGVTTQVVEDRLYLSNVLAERTTDYFAQDECGNVWYFGEDTVELDASGHVVSTEGSFRAGVDGAQPGVVMQANPQLFRDFRQEWYLGQAEDQFRVVSLNATVTVPYGTFHHAMRTRETTALEPGVVDNKYYVRGIGEVKEVTVRGGDERMVLVAIHH